MMLQKPHPDDIQSISWLIIGSFSAWGGLVRYLMDSEFAARQWSWMAVFSQIIISCFTGFLGGFYSYEQGLNEYRMLIVAGICSTLGSTLLRWLWRRFLKKQENR
ncbi:holin [Salmonella enterica subsp. enterica]|nr:holin [Salmonella enterica subsp. enterica]EDT7315910.1 holin [Salmonella enterica subsp. enterica]